MKQLTRSEAIKLLVQIEKEKIDQLSKDEMARLLLDLSRDDLNTISNRDLAYQIEAALGGPVKIVDSN